MSIDIAQRALWHALCIAALCVLPLCARAAHETGTVKGTAYYEDGVPYIGNIVIRSDDANYWIVRKTAIDGSFEAVDVPIGEKIVNIDRGNEDSRRVVTVTADSVTKAALVLKRTGGIILTLTSPNHRMALDAASKVKGTWIADFHPEAGRCYQLPDGRFWFPDVPANIKSFMVEITRGVSDAFVTTQQWKFTEPDPKRTLTWAIAPLATVAIRIVDQQGNLLRNAALASVRLEIPPQADQTSGLVSLPNPATNADGMLSLGPLVEGFQYGISVFHNDTTGGIRRFTVTTKGEANPPDYRLSLRPRDITQRVYTPTGAPATITAMHLSYSWHGQVILREATTDGEGDVIWNDIPPVPAIVWGDGIPVGEIPPEATDVRAPLPALADTSQYPYEITFTFHLAADEDLGKLDRYACSGLEWMADYSVPPISGQLPPPSIIYTTTPEDGPLKTVSASIYGQAHVGTPIQLVLWSSTSGRYAIVHDLYLPPNCGNYPPEGGTLTVPAPEPIVVKLQLQSPVSERIPAVNPFTVIPDDESTLARLLRNKVNQKHALPVPKALGNGEYQVSLPWAGTYRLCIDGYSREVSAAALRFTVSTTSRLVKLTMPEPLLQVSPGTKVCCLPFSSPTIPITFLAAQGATSMPIYMDKQSLLAYWYNESPDETLYLWQSSAPAQPMRALHPRTVKLVITGNAVDDTTVILQPLLPAKDTIPNPAPHQEMDSIWSSAFSPPDESVPHQETDVALWSPRLLRCGETVQLNLWPGEYVVCRQRDKLPLATFSVSAQAMPDAVIAVQLPGWDQPSVLRDLPTRNIELQLPKGINYGRMMTDMMVTDVTGAYQALITDTYQHGTQQAIRLNVPYTVKSLTLQRLSSGLVRDIDVSNATTTTITLSAWQPGLPCAGTITNTDGQPYTKKLIVYTPTGLHTSIMPDKTGHFIIAGISPGLLAIQTAEENPVTWQIEIPEKGKSDIILTLRAPIAPILFTQRNSPHPGYNVHPVWWLPDSGPATYMRDYCTNFHLRFASLPEGEGWVWKLLDESHGITSTERTGLGTMTSDEVLSGWMYIIEDFRTLMGPSMGIVLPYRPGAYRPGAIRLEGLGDRVGAGIYVAQPDWVVNPTLQCISATLHGIPPGQYRLKLMTADAIISQTVTVTSAGSYIWLK